MKKFLTTYLILLVGIFCWIVFYEPNSLSHTYYTIYNNNLKGLKVVVIADLHPKPNQEKRIKQVVEATNSVEPDLVFLLGDYVSGHLEQQTLPIEITAKNLSLLKSKLGVYAVLGNHDSWANARKIKSELENNNINVLDNKNINIKDQKYDFYISGISDLTTGYPNIEKALKDVQMPNIFLSHNPDIFPKLPENITLVLAGHTHGGQVIFPYLGPLLVPSDYGKKYSSGLIEENNKKMIVSKGIGTSILPIRFNCKPEIIIINFK